MIANPWEPDRLLHPSGRLKITLLFCDRYRIAIGADSRQHQRQNLRASAAAPAKQTMGEAVGGIPSQFVCAEPAHSVGNRHSRKSGREPKTVWQPSQVMPPFRETPLAVLLSKTELTRQGCRTHQNTIGFDPRAINRLPATFTTGLLNSRMQGRSMAFHPGIESRGGVRKVQLRITLHQIESRTKGAFCRLPGVSHGPKPGEIEMGMAQPMHRTHWLRASRQVAIDQGNGL